MDFGNGDTEHTTYETNRQPMIVLVTDGLPTYQCKKAVGVNDLETAYKNFKPLTTTDRDGEGGEDEETGSYGLGVMRAAKYYLPKITKNYGRDVLVYSIAAKDYGNSDNTARDKQSYMKVVMHPTDELIDSLAYTTGTRFGRYFSDALKKDTAYNTAVSNGVTDYYNYSQAYSVGVTDSSTLTGMISDFLANDESLMYYDMILKTPTGATVTDPIGEGMELKTDPVLRFAGINYVSNEKDGPTTKNGVTTTVYHYNYPDYVDPYSNRVCAISGITATVTTKADGKQDVIFTVPSSAIPAYIPNLNLKETERWYYEELPARLIYQVGLTEESEAEVAALKETGGENIYYTNRWQDGEQASSVFTPTVKNPYYANGAHASGSAVKTANPTSTNSNSSTMSTANYLHTNALGNNGKLEFKADPPTVTIPVEKEWDGATGSSVELSLYYADGKNTKAYPLMVPDENGQPTTTQYKLTLTAEDGWTGVFKDVPKPDEGRTYYVYESPVGGYATSYSNSVSGLYIDGKNGSVKLAEVTFGDKKTLAEQVTVINVSGARLPSTGGSGTTVLYLLGAGVLGAALWLSLRSSVHHRKKYSR